MAASWRSGRGPISKGLDASFGASSGEWAGCEDVQGGLVDVVNVVMRSGAFSMNLESLLPCCACPKQAGTGGPRWIQYRLATPAVAFRK